MCILGQILLTIIYKIKLYVIAIFYLKKVEHWQFHMVEPNICPSVYNVLYMETQIYRFTIIILIQYI